MGGKSKSKQQTTNTSSNTNIVNDGKFAGAGNVTIDESDHSVEDSNNTDNSVRVKDSNNTDNSIENDGDYAGNNGTINITDGGALKEAFGFGRSALEANENTLERAFDFGSDAFDFGSDALDEVQTIATRAFDNSTEQAENFSDNVQSMLENGQRSQENILKNAAKSNSEDRKVITQLAQSTALAGQDIVAKSSQKMTLYMSLALGIGFVAIVFLGSRK